MNLCRYKIYKKYIKRLICIMGGALLIFPAISNALNYMYAKDDTWARILWHNYYEDEGYIENVYIGSSHVYSDINPAMLDEINGLYNFNLSSSSQRLNGSYYLLKEADHNNPISHVYLELYYSCNVKDNFASNIDPIDTQYNKNWVNTDYMNISVNKLAYMLSIAGPEKYVDILLPFSRYRAELDNWDYIKRTIQDKRNSSYLTYDYYYNYDDGNGMEEYLRQGFRYSTRVLPNENGMIFEQSRILEENPIGEKSEKYLRRIISYCQNRDIPITLFVSPMNELLLVSTEHYDNYVNQVRKIAEEYQVDFYDFNLAKEEYLPIHHGEYFMDIGHLNTAGANMFTTFFSEVVSREFSENEEYFYSSYTEKLQSIPPNIYGLYYRDSEITEGSSDTIRTFWIASNREEGMEYQIIMVPIEGEQYTVQDFAENTEFMVHHDEHGTCIIVARMIGEPNNIQTYEFNY